MNTVRIRSTADVVGGLVRLCMGVLESELLTDSLAHNAYFTTTTTGMIPYTASKPT